MGKMLMKVKVKAGAGREVVEEKDPITLHVSVKENAKGNYANFRVRQIISEHYKIPLERVRMIKGFQIPSKMFEILD